VNQYFLNPHVQSTSGACVVDLTPPTFAGIASLAPQANGSLQVGWLAATDVTTPLSYEIYVQAATATGLFSLSNIAAISRGLSAKIFADALAAILVNGVTYFVGVRAVDGVGNRDSNLVSLSAISSGVIADDLATLASDLESIAETLAQAVNPEFVATLEDEELLATLDDDESELVAELVCED